MRGIEKIQLESVLMPYEISQGKSITWNVVAVRVDADHTLALQKIQISSSKERCVVYAPESWSATRRRSENYGFYDDDERPLIKCCVCAKSSS